MLRTTCHRLISALKSNSYLTNNFCRDPDKILKLNQFVPYQQNCWCLFASRLLYSTSSLPEDMAALLEAKECNTSQTEVMDDTKILTEQVEDAGVDDKQDETGAKRSLTDQHEQDEGQADTKIAKTELSEEVHINFYR